MAPQGVRLERLAPWLICGVVFATAAWASEPYAVGVFHDDGVYVVLAKALASGEGYRYLNLPGAPLATHYPPGYPLLLAALWRISPNFPQNIGLFQIANAVALALTAWSISVFARRALGWSHWAAIATGLAATLSYPLIGLAGHVLSEVLFVAVLIPALILGERLARAEAASRDAWLAGAAAGAVTLVRTHGIALVASLVLVLLIRRRWRHAAFTATGALLVIAPWQLWVAANDAALADVLRGKYGSYTPWLMEGMRAGAAFIGATIAANLREINALLADRFSVSDHALPRLVTGLVVAAFAVAGAVRLRFRTPVTVAFSVLYVAILLVWPWNPWRFFYAIWPIVVLFLVATVHWLFEVRRTAITVAAAGLVVASILAIGALRADVRAYRNRAWYQPAQRATRTVAPLVRWVTASTALDDIVAVDVEQLVYLFTGRRAVPPSGFAATDYVTPPTFAATTESLRRVVAELPVTFVATISSSVYRSAHQLSADAHPSSSAPRLIRLASIPGGGAFRVERRDSLVNQP